MDKKGAILLIGFIAIFSFLLGRWSYPKLPVSESSTSLEKNSSLSSRANTMTGSERSQTIGPQRPQETASTNHNLTKEECLALSKEDRLQLLKKGLLIVDGSEQAAFMEGVIKSLNEEELRLGNWPSQQVWHDLWKQAGRLHPEKTLSSFRRYHSRKDARILMAGWLESHPAAALAWAQSPKTSFHESAAAAYALTKDANGDPEKLLATISQLPSDGLVLKDALVDYFSLAETTEKNEGSAAIYQNLPESLKPHAWKITMRRLSHTDSQEAVDWLNDHVDDEGADYSQTTRIFSEFARKDPAGITAWAATLPTLKEGETHPVETTYKAWKSKDSDAAETWLQNLTDNPAWAQRLRERP